MKLYYIKSFKEEIIMADIKMEDLEKMMEEDDELFEEEFDMEEKKVNQKAFELGEKIGKFMNSKPVVIGKKIAMAATVVGGSILIYTKGFSDGAKSVAVDEIDDMFDDPELEELLRLEAEVDGTTNDEQ
jgi:predicted phage tail protein